jgi:hypothetical protein
MHDCAMVLGVPFSTLQRIEKFIMEKHHQLPIIEKGIHWAMARRNKGYSTISNKLRTLLIIASNDYPHVVVLPNTKDTLQVKNAEGAKVLIRKILTMVCLGTILSYIIHDNPTIKNTVGEHAFCYIVGGLGMQQFTNLHKKMCSCTESVGLQMLHCLM